jgi:hypothetical protein
MKVMSKCDIRTEDWKHVAMFDEYASMRSKREKFRYITIYLAEKYRMSESTVKRIVRRFSAEARV